MPLHWHSKVVVGKGSLDLALIEVEEHIESLYVPVFADLSVLNEGDELSILGYGQSGRSTGAAHMTRGILSSKGAELLRTDAAVLAAHSGSLVVNRERQAVGWAFRSVRGELGDIRPICNLVPALRAVVSDAPPCPTSLSSLSSTPSASSEVSEAMSVAADAEIATLCAARAIDVDARSDTPSDDSRYDPLIMETLRAMQCEQRRMYESMQAQLRLQEEQNQRTQALLRNELDVARALAGIDSSGVPTRMAVRMQSAARAMLGRRRLREARRRVLVLQRCARARPVRARLGRIKAVIVMVQAAMRRASQKRRFQAIRAKVVTLQRFVRGWLARRRSRSAVSQATLIQAQQRAHRQRTAFLRVRARVTCLQAHARRRLYCAHAPLRFPLSPRPSGVCPITLEAFVEPVVASDGHVYERWAIEQWLAKERVSPQTRRPLSQTLVPFFAVVQAAERYLECRPNAAVFASSRQVRSLGRRLANHAAAHQRLSGQMRARENALHLARLALERERQAATRHRQATERERQAQCDGEADDGRDVEDVYEQLALLQAQLKAAQAAVNDAVREREEEKKQRRQYQGQIVNLKRQADDALMRQHSLEADLAWYKKRGSA